MKKWLVAGALLAPFFLSMARADEAKTRVANEKAAPLTRTLIDRDALRSIEIITDRHESIAQFFARQKLVFASAPMDGAKPLGNAGGFKSDKTRRVFVSYPIPNDSNFAPNLFGTYLDLQPPSPEMLALLGDQSAGNSLWIFALDNPAQELAEASKKRLARLVGRIQTLGLYSFLQEQKMLSYAGAQK